jgi:hypothetical protein
VATAGLPSTGLRHNAIFVAMSADSIPYITFTRRNIVTDYR